MASAAPPEKMILLRLELEKYEPYALFRDRVLAGEDPSEAARQVCVRHGLPTDPLDAETVLKSLGTYCGGLVYGPDRRLLVKVEPLQEVEGLHVLARVDGERNAVRAHVVEQLGVEAAAFATGEIIERLIDSYLGVMQAADPRGAMFELGHALEGFVKKVATVDPPVTIPSSSRTLGQVATTLKNAGRLNSKHFALVMGLTALRNAADHTGDAEIGGATWVVSSETVVLANQLAWRLMRSILATRSGNPEL